MKILGYEFSEFEVVDHPSAPKLVVKNWSDLTGNNISIALNVEYSQKQHVYSHLISTDDEGYSNWTKSDFKKLADEFNNDPDLDHIWEAAYRDAIIFCINYEKRQIEESKLDLKKYEKQLTELETGAQ